MLRNESCNFESFLFKTSKHLQQTMKPRTKEESRTELTHYSKSQQLLNNNEYGSVNQSNQSIENDNNNNNKPTKSQRRRQTELSIFSLHSELSRPIENIPSPAKIYLIVNIIIAALTIVLMLETESQFITAEIPHLAADLSCAIIILSTQYLIKYKKNNNNYPLGRPQMENVGVLIISVLLIMAYGYLVYASITKIYVIYHEDSHKINTNQTVYGIMGLIFVINLSLAIFLRHYRSTPSNKAMSVDAIQHLIVNLITFSAVIFVGYMEGDYIYVDPIGAMSISIMIIIVWISIGYGHIKQIIGYKANELDMNELHDLIKQELNQQQYQLCAYHYGKDLFVEITLIIIQDMNISEFYQQCNDLKRKLQVVEFVERVFVNIEYNNDDRMKLRNNDQSLL